MQIRFPQGFLWGSATAAYQVEGAAAEDGRGPSIWDTFSHAPGNTANGDTGDVACDQYHRLDADLDLIQNLGLRAYRFSASWSRVLPSGRGPVNPRGLDHYERLVDGLLERGVVPMMTLYHWDLPQALQDEGGWLNRDTVPAFVEFALAVRRRIGDRVPYWVTVNEPWCAAFLGYGTGVHAPGLRDPAAALEAAHHLLLAHGSAVRALRADGLKNAIGPALNLTSEIPATEDPLDVAAARRLDGTENRLFLDPLFRGAYPEDVVAFHRPVTDFSFVRDGDLATIAQPVDFLGVNYYERHLTRADPNDPERGAVFTYPGEARTAVGVGVNPEGLQEVLLRLHREYTRAPLHVTENGAAFDDETGPDGEVNDAGRVAFLDGHFRAAHAALQAGANLKGYFVWSLLDNFEWASGYSKRYGIVHVDYRTQERRPKQSARWYGEVIRRNGLD
ncbi:MAG TPA: GH1 family beta-glucosidase [Deinococcales bacterium]|nr:GH1 family beta-glucosidase [Deinococcales bacterium]